MATIPSAGQVLLTDANGNGYICNIINKQSDGSFQAQPGDSSSIVSCTLGGSLSLVSSPGGQGTWFTQLPNESSVGVQPNGPNKNPTIKLPASFGS